MATVSAIVGWLIGGASTFLGLMFLLVPGPAKAVALAFIIPGLIIIPPLTKVLRESMPFLRPWFAPPLAAFGVWVALCVSFGPLMSQSSANKERGRATRSVERHAPTPAPEAQQDARAAIERLIAEGTLASTTQAMVELNNRFTATELRGAGLAPVMDRAKAAYNKASLTSRAATYAARLDDYGTRKLAEVSTVPPTTVADMWDRQSVFEDVARQLEEGHQFKGDPAVAAAMTRLRQALVTKQSAAFPVLRRGYGQIVGRAVWEQDVEVIVQGSGSRTIRFIAGMFAANRNVASAQANALPHIRKLRFNRSQYEWYRGSASQFYTLETPVDAAVGYWEGEAFKVVGP